MQAVANAAARVGASFEPGTLTGKCSAGLCGVAALLRLAFQATGLHLLLHNRCSASHTATHVCCMLWGRICAASVSVAHWDSISHVLSMFAG